MKKYTHLFLALLCLPLLFACTPDLSDITLPTNADTTEFKMKATITAIGSTIEVNVTEGPYGAEGPYHVHTPEDTRYLGRSGEPIKRGELSVGDAVEITYSGQVMLSYPPQIVAFAIAVK